MVDEAVLANLKAVLAQAEATEDSLRALDSKLEFGRSDPIVQQVNSLLRQAAEGLARAELGAPVPKAVTPSSPAARTVSLGDLLIAASNLRAVLRTVLPEKSEEGSARGEEVERLKAKLAEAEVRSLYVVDDELRDRCMDLLVRPGKADTAVRDAAVVLEHRIRKAAGLGPEDYGVSLVDKALSPKTGLLDFGGLKPEREGIHQLYRGVIAFFKNPTSHQIIQDYDVTRARQVVGLIDLLLQLLREAKRKEAAAETRKPATPRS
ncbi:MAG: TIGR02391 family protein [Chloroflexi bacterium]|nr:TIGR02391 family protein [Chloroflexota bacterium]